MKTVAHCASGRLGLIGNAFRSSCFALAGCTRMLAGGVGVRSARFGLSFFLKKGFDVCFDGEWCSVVVVQVVVVVVIVVVPVVVVAVVVVVVAALSL